MEITYTPDSISFDCVNCGTKHVITRRSPDSIISGIFCQGCDEQYYTRWDGMLHRGPIEASASPMTKEEASSNENAALFHSLVSALISDLNAAYIKASRALSYASEDEQAALRLTMAAINHLSGKVRPMRDGEALSEQE